MKSIFRTAAAVLCILVITVCAILISEKLFRHARADLTEQKLYTLSRGTRNILSQLNQPVRLKLYYAKTAALKGPEGIRYYNTYYLYVRDLLQEYVDRAGNHLQLTVIDPRRFSDDEDDAIRLGVKRFPLEGDDSFFFGLVAQTELGKQAVIPFFEPDRQEFVEYDISKLISTVTRPAKKKIGILSSIPGVSIDVSPYMAQMMRMQGKEPPAPWTIVTQLREDYEVVPMQVDAESIGDDVDYLMVVQPKDLPSKTLFAIDQYVMKGGKLLVFVDPHCMADRPSEEEQRDQYAMMDYKTGSELNSLLRGWGVEMAPDTIAVDRDLALEAPVAPGAAPTRVVVFMELKDPSMNPSEVITANLHSVRVLFPGVLKPVEGAGTVVTPLLETTAAGAEWQPANRYDLLMFNPETALKAAEKSSGKLMLACRVSGTFKTNFPEGLPSEKPKTGEEKKAEEAEKDATETATPTPDAIKSSSPDAEVLVFADVDMIADNIAYRQTFFGPALAGDNASLVLNAFDFLSGSGDLVAVRSRGAFSRPFKVVDKIESKAEAASSAKVDALKKKIEESQKKLRELGTPENQEEVKLLRSKAMSERQQIQEEIRQAQKELRKVSAGKRENIEALKSSLETLNMVWAPAVVLFIAIVLAVVRSIRAWRYARRRV